MVNGKPIDKPSGASQEDLERLEALGYGTSNAFVAATGDGPPPEPRDWAPVINAYREAISYDIRREWPSALRILRSLTKEQPASSIFWERLAQTAERSERFDIAIEASARMISLNPESPDALVAAAFIGLKARRFEDATRYANQALSLTGSSGPLAASAFEVLTRVALARRDPVIARQQADLATAANPARPLRSLVEARLHLDQRRFE